MLNRTYDQQVCSIARALEIVGERWSLLIMRDVLRGMHRFDDLQESLGVTRSVLSARLAWLVDEGLLRRHRYQERPPRYEYRATRKGVELWPVLMHLMQWGDRHYPAEGGPPTLVEHRGCGGRVNEHLICERCGEPMGASDVQGVPGPGGRSREPDLEAAEVAAAASDRA